MQKTIQRKTESEKPAVQAVIKPHPVDKIRIKRACQLFDLSESFVRHGIMKGLIPCYKLAGATFVSIRDIERLIENGKSN